ncbi:MAG: hypothetical protein ACM362_05140 [Candidatus Methylomirabilota bacterium]
MGEADHAMIPLDLAHASGSSMTRGAAGGRVCGGVATALLADLIARDGAVWARQASLSMAPLIQPGDAVHLVPLDREQIARGTLIAYRREELLVVHRLLTWGHAGVVTKGDALTSPDPLVAWEQVVAQVTALRRTGKPPADLGAFPWPLINGVLSSISAIASRLSAENGTGGSWPPLPWVAWKVLRVPFHLARLLVP